MCRVYEVKRTSWLQKATSISQRRSHDSGRVAVRFQGTKLEIEIEFFAETLKSEGLS